MSEANSYNTRYSKLSRIWNQVEENKTASSRIIKKQILSYPLTIIKKTNELILPSEIVYYDLYDFIGITYRVGGSAPIPFSAYIESSPEQWHWKYPVYDFRVPVGEKPEDITGTTSDFWIYRSTIGSIKQTHHFNLFPDWAIQYTKMKHYLYSIEDESEPVFVDDLSIFFRWIKKGIGYDFENYVFFTLPVDQELLLSLSLVIKNKRIMDAIQGKQIQEG